jgi:hypothetical protein
MTDTEILNYLQESVTYRRRRKGPEDIEIGSVTFTVGLRPKNLRELLVEAIAVDLGVREQRACSEVTAELLGGGNS